MKLRPIWVPYGTSSENKMVVNSLKFFWIRTKKSHWSFSMDDYNHRKKFKQRTFWYAPRNDSFHIKFDYSWQLLIFKEDYKNDKSCSWKWPSLVTFFVRIFFTFFLSWIFIRWMLCFYKYIYPLVCKNLDSLHVRRNCRVYAAYSSRNMWVRPGSDPDWTRIRPKIL